MKISKICVQSRGGYNIWTHLLFMSDLHLGCTLANIPKIRSDLNRARELGARVIMIGDIFDAVLPPDSKRYKPSTVVASLQGRDDLLSAAIDYAFDILEPYSDLIDLIGLGNHEETTIKYHTVDPVSLLIGRLNQANREKGVNKRIIHGGWTGYILYTVLPSGTNTRKRGGRVYKVLYMHGFGGSAPVTKGVIHVNRKSVNWVYDLMVFGHMHHGWGVRRVLIDISTSGKGKLKVTYPKAVQTGTYLRYYQVNDTPSVVSYTEKGDSPPRPQGGVFVRFRWVGKERELEHIVEI